MSSVRKQQIPCEILENGISLINAKRILGVSSCETVHYVHLKK